MEDLINDQIFESISEEYQIFKVTLMQLIGMGGKKYPIIKYAIRDEQEELVRHNDMSFFNTLEDAQQALSEIVQKRFEEQSQWLNH